MAVWEIHIVTAELKPFLFINLLGFFFFFLVKTLEEYHFRLTEMFC